MHISYSPNILAIRWQLLQLFCLCLSLSALLTVVYLLTPSKPSLIYTNKQNIQLNSICSLWVILYWVWWGFYWKHLEKGSERMKVGIGKKRKGIEWSWSKRAWGINKYHSGWNFYFSEKIWIRADRLCIL